MNLIPRLILTFAALPLVAQTTTPDAHHPAHLRAVMRPPASTLPPKATLLSTAEAAPARRALPPLKILPDFPLQDRDGHTISAQTVGTRLVAARTLLAPQPTAASLITFQSPAIATPATHWLLLYRDQACLPCDRLMNTLAASASADFQRGTPYVVIVAAKNRNGLETVRAANAVFSSATWLADTNHQALSALKPRGTPMLYAMDGNRIAFSIPGNLDNPALVNTIADNWIKGSAKPLTTQ